MGKQAREDVESTQASKRPCSEALDVTKYLSLLTQSVLDQLVRDLLADPSTSSTTTSLIEARLSSAMHAYSQSVRQRVDVAIKRLESRDHRSVTADDYAQAMIPFLKDVDHVRSFPRTCEGKNKLAMELLLYLVGNSYCDMEMSVKACGYGERGGFDKKADEKLVEIVKARKDEEGYSPKFMGEVDRTLARLDRETDMLGAYGIEPWFPKTKKLFEDMVEDGQQMEEEGKMKDTDSEVLDISSDED